MGFLSVSYAHSGVLQDAITAIVSDLQPVCDVFNTQKPRDYTTYEDFINLPFDSENLACIYMLANRMKACNPRAFLLIGIGGSNLGALAVLQALKGKLYNYFCHDIQYYYADTVDGHAINDLVRLLEGHLQQGDEVIINIVSKSGTTLETAANMHVFLRLLKQYKGASYYHSIVVTTDHGSELWQLAERNHFATLAIPATVGGRFSVFSAAGLFPLAVLGVDIHALCLGAQRITPHLTKWNAETNHALTTAGILAYHYARGVHIHNSFFFSLDFELLGAWYRQLIAESLGKSNTHGMRTGILPIVSLASIDLHSVGQLYFGGLNNIVTTFVSIEHADSDLTIKPLQELNSYMPSVQNKECANIMRAILLGTQRAYELSLLPYISIELPEKNAYYMGQLLQLYMIQVVYLGHLLDVNPFDQPAVELYKQQTRKMLVRE